jgi:hypothetical protein
MSNESASPLADVVAVPKTSSRLTRVTGALIALGIVLSVVALPDAGNRVRFGYAYIWGFAFLWTVVLGSLFFVGLQHLTSAVWSVVVRRVAEMIAAPMWLLGLLFLPVLLFVLLPDQFPVFPWADAALVDNDQLLLAKRAYLNVPFFVIRAVVFLGLWIAFSRYFVGKSLKQDRGEGGFAASAAMRRMSAPFTLVFAATTTLAGVDWLMSLNPHWFSTMFGVYIFAGLVVASLAAITIATVWMRNAGILGSGVVTEDHLYNLGCLLFAFVCFWAYIAFSQYMLIWYANVPEESFYFVSRVKGGWLPVSVALAVVRFAVPFMALLSRRAKMNPRILFWVSILMLAGQLLDLYWIVMPELHEAYPVLGWQEIGPSLLMVGVVILYATRFLGRNAPLAVGDPLLGESRKFRL